MKLGTTARPPLASQTPRPKVLEQYTIHPVAALWPLLGEADLQEMAMDIKEHGLQESIWMFEKQVLDGRNRIVACDMAGVVPTFQQWKPNSAAETPITFIMSKNLHRRHMSASVRAAVGVSIEEWIKDENARLKEEQAKVAANFSAPVAKPDVPLPATTPPPAIDPSGVFASPTPAGPTSGPAPAAPAPPAAPAAGVTPTPPPVASPKPSAPSPSLVNPFGIGDAATATTGKQGRTRDQAAAAVGVSSGYLADAKDVKKASPAMFQKVASGEISIPKAQEELVDLARQQGDLERLGLRPGAKRAAEERLDLRAARKAKPRIEIKKFTPVESSRVAVSIEAVFGSPEKAEEWLNKMQDEPSVLGLKYDVKEALSPKKKVSK